MTYEEAAALRPGDVIDYRPARARGTVTAKVTGRVHKFPHHGEVVFVPVTGALVHMQRIVCLREKAKQRGRRRA